MAQPLAVDGAIQFAERSFGPGGQRLLHARAPGSRSSPAPSGRRCPRCRAGRGSASARAPRRPRRRGTGPAPGGRAGEASGGGLGVDLPDPQHPVVDRNLGARLPGSSKSVSASAGCHARCSVPAGTGIPARLRGRPCGCAGHRAGHSRPRAPVRSGRAHDDGRPMKAVTWHGQRDVRVEEVPDPFVQEPTDAVIRVTTSQHLRLGPAPLRAAGAVHGRRQHPRPREHGPGRGGRLGGAAT